MRKNRIEQGATKLAIKKKIYWHEYKVYASEQPPAGDSTVAMNTFFALSFSFNSPRLLFFHFFYSFSFHS